MILHLDADGFFASVEQALNPQLAGRPVATGSERGLVIALSYEAKARGIRRGMLARDAKKLCPELVFVPGHYENYGLFSRRIFAIMRRYSPQVEEYSIDEAFADLKGLRRLHHAGYGEIAGRMQADIHREVGVTVSVGLSLTKSLAKLASKYRKPAGFTFVNERARPSFLSLIPLEKVWGFGRNSVALLEKNGLRTALDFTLQPLERVKKWLGKVGVEIWQELRGESVWPVKVEEKSSYASISKFRTFTPATDSAPVLLARLMRNVEAATAKARRFKLAARQMILVLRDSTFLDDALKIELSRPSAALLDLSGVAREKFTHLFQPRKMYRATGVVLCELKEDKNVQLTIFEDPLRIVHVANAAQAIDAINHRYGRHTIGVADSLIARPHTDSSMRPSAPQNPEAEIPHLGLAIAKTRLV